MSRFYIENGEILDCGFFLGSKEQYVDIMNKQDQRIAELEQELADLKEKYNKVNDKLKNITEEVENNFVDGQDYEKLKQELAELKEKAIVPRFKRQEIVYCFSYGKIQLFNVVAYLDNQITLCEDRETGKLEFVNNDYLCINKQEAQEKLKEMQGNE